MANKPSRRSMLFRWFIALLLLCLYGFSIAARLESPTSLDLWRSLSHVITFFLVIYLLFKPIISSYEITANLWKSPDIRKPYCGIISTLGITYISSERRDEIAWGRFSKKRMADDLIVLVTVDGILAFFPRAVFQSDSDWKNVRQRIENKVVEAV